MIDPGGPGGSAGVVDVDLHVHIESPATLMGYLDAGLAEFMQETAFEPPPSPVTLYPPNAPITLAPEWAANGAVHPAATVEDLQRNVLDPRGVETAVLTCYWGIESVRHPDVAAGLARAVNDWLIAEWLDRDPRLRASMVVPAFVPAEAAAEIDRVGGHPGVVQVLLPVRSWRLYGNRIWHPMFEAMERHDLVAGVHYGGNPDGPPTPTGWPAHLIEDHATITQIYIAQLASVVGEGLFAKFPSLRMSFLESGFAWLGPALFRMDTLWKGLRRDVPWVSTFPSQIVFSHIRFSTQPLDAGPPELFKKTLGWIGADDLLMYASDYPHGHEGDISDLLALMPESSHRKVMADNARDHYRLGPSKRVVGA